MKATLRKAQRCFNRLRLSTHQFGYGNIASRSCTHCDAFLSRRMKPLHGVRVLDLSRVVSGPFCTMLLGDLGAEVIKIEEPLAGDESRTFGPPFVAGESAYYLSINRNKKSCTLDLKSANGKRVLTALARQSDVLVDNFRPGAFARLGFDDTWAEKTNPRLIRCSISGFGYERVFLTADSNAISD